MAARTRLLLEGPVAPTLLRLAAPNVLVMVLQATVSTLDAVFVGWLGGDALAGVSVVFPLVMLMQTMSAGGMGGGVASAVARALGAGRQKEADALVAHALIIALGMGAVFTAAALAGGPWLYRALGGTADSRRRSRLLSLISGGPSRTGSTNTLSRVRGTGNMLCRPGMAPWGHLSRARSPMIIAGGPSAPPRRLLSAAAHVLCVGILLLASTSLGPASSPVVARLLRVGLFRDKIRCVAPGPSTRFFTNSRSSCPALVGPFRAHAPQVGIGRG